MQAIRCMDNQEVAENATMVSSSTRNLGDGVNVFLSFAELAEEYQQYSAEINSSAEDTYRYLNFNAMDSYQS